MTVPRGKRLHWVGALAALALVVGVAVVVFRNNQGESNPDRSKVTVENAAYACQAFVERELDDPGSAKFGPYHVRRTAGSDVFMVEGSMVVDDDTNNPRDYTCEVINEGGKWREIRVLVP